MIARIDATRFSDEYAHGPNCLMGCDSTLSRIFIVRYRSIEEEICNNCVPNDLKYYMQIKRIEGYHLEELPCELKSDFLENVKRNKDILTYNVDQSKYEKTYVAYIDILGYKKLIKSLSADAPKVLTKIIKDSVIEHQGIYKSVQLALFSDSIILWGNGEHIFNLLNIINVIEFIRGGFQKKGIFLRGGITLGDHFNIKNIIVSPALIRSYMMESTEAICPRIIIEDNIYNKLILELEQERGGSLGVLSKGYFRLVNSNKFFRDIDGKYILHPLLHSNGVNFLFCGNTGEWVYGDAPLTEERIIAVRDSGLKYLEDYRDTLNKELLKVLELRERMKILYLIEQFNKTIDILNIEKEYKLKLQFVY